MAAKAGPPAASCSADALHTARQENVRLQAEITRQQAVLAKQQVELDDNSRRLAELHADNERLAAQLATATRKVDVRKLAPMRRAASEIISAMGTRSERRRLDLVVLAAMGFAEGSKTFRFDRVAEGSVAAPVRAREETAALASASVASVSAQMAVAAPSQDAVATEAGAAASEDPTATPEPDDSAAAPDELATFAARVARLREEEEGAPGPPPMPPIGTLTAPPPTRLADGQLIILPGEGVRSAASGRLCVVAGLNAVRLVGESGDESARAYDDNCGSQQVLPWRPSGDTGREAALRRDLESLLGPAAGALRAQTQAKDTFSSSSDAVRLREALESSVAQAEAFAAVAERLRTLVALAPRARAACAAILAAASSVDVELPAAVAAWWSREKKVRCLRSGLDPSRAPQRPARAPLLPPPAST